MRERNFVMLVIIIFIALFAGWVVQPDNPGLHIGSFTKDIKIHEGLDLQGGLQVLLQAAGVDCNSVSKASLEAATALRIRRHAFPSCDILSVSFRDGLMAK